jgi:hypothetical protein
MPLKQVLRQLCEAKPDILDADLLLFRGKGIVSHMIQSYGRGKYSHVAKASWLKGELFCAEVRELAGGRIVTLSSQVQKFPGAIDVYRTNPLELPQYNRAEADKLMLLFAGVEYGYLDILETYALHAWPLKYLAQANVDDDFVSKRPPYCSAACAIADRVGGGVDPVPNLADKQTEPSDLARSQLYRYVCTLIPDEAPTACPAPATTTNEAAEKMSEAGDSVTVQEAVAESLNGAD